MDEFPFRTTETKSKNCTVCTKNRSRKRNNTSYEKKHQKEKWKLKNDHVEKYSQWKLKTVQMVFRTSTGIGVGGRLSSGKWAGFPSRCSFSRTRPPMILFTSCCWGIADGCCLAIYNEKFEHGFRLEKHEK